MTIKSGWLRTDQAEKRNEKKWNGKERSCGVQVQGIEGEGIKAWADMYRNETRLDKGGLPVARVVLLWS
jgi:hypothetical protein